MQDTLYADVVLAAKHGRTAVARVLASAGHAFDLWAGEDLRDRLDRYPGGSPFRKCIVETAQWGGLVDDPVWPLDGARFLDLESPDLARKYKRGYHSRTDPTAYLKTWARILENFRLPAEPDDDSSAQEVVSYWQSAEATLFGLDWRSEREWVGSWTFYGVFKLYLLQQERLWADPGIDAIPMPMGGAKSGGSFEGGWKCLVELGILQPLPAPNKNLKRFAKAQFSEGMSRTKQAHAGCASLATLAESRAVHVNSGIYLLGRRADS